MFCFLFGKVLQIVDATRASKQSFSSYLNEAEKLTIYYDVIYFISFYI